MNITGIEWVKNPDGSQGCTLNSKTGCLNHTPEGLCLGGLFPCYGFKLAHGRLKPLYLANTNVAPGAKGGTMKVMVQGQIRATEREGDYADPFYPRFWEERLKQPNQILKPAGIFLDDMSDWMLDCWPREWTEYELQVMRENPQHRIYTLTKQSQNLPNFSPFPENCWVGVTATNNLKFHEALFNLEIVVAPIRFISIEPLLGQIPMNEGKIERMIDTLDWLIIGACTGTQAAMMALAMRESPEAINRVMPLNNRLYTLQPRIGWLQEIVEAADKAGIKVFLKDNLRPLLEHDHRTFMNPLYWRNGYYTSPEHPNIDLWLRQELPGKVVANCPK